LSECNESFDIVDRDGAVIKLANQLPCTWAWTSCPAWPSARRSSSQTSGWSGGSFRPCSSRSSQGSTNGRGDRFAGRDTATAALEDSAARIALVESIKAAIFSVDRDLRLIAGSSLFDELSHAAGQPARLPGSQVLDALASGQHTDCTRVRSPASTSRSGEGSRGSHNTIIGALSMSEDSPGAEFADSCDRRHESFTMRFAISSTHE
jgi:hypothetical protein